MWRANFVHKSIEHKNCASGLGGISIRGVFCYGRGGSRWVGGVSGVAGQSHNIECSTICISLFTWLIVRHSALTIVNFFNGIRNVLLSYSCSDRLDLLFINQYSYQDLVAGGWISDCSARC